MLGFRVWNTERKRFIEDLNFKMYHTGELVIYDYNGDKVDTPDYIIPMQSTGLKDRTGKELFEQDIIMVVRLNDDSRPPIPLICESIPQIYNLLMGRYRNHPFTIIGNSLENPELLENL